MIYIGIDNGLDGAVVALDSAGRKLVAEVMPTVTVGKGGKRRRLDELGLWDLLHDLAEANAFDAYCSIEQARPMPRDGGVGGFRYGQGYGCARGMLTALSKIHGLAWDEVAPPTWQRVVLRDLPGDDTKARAVARVQRAVPGLDLTPGRKVKPHDGLADAACLALYGLERRGRPAEDT